MLLDGIISSRIESAFSGPQRIVFLVGAGISVPSWVPDFGSLNKEVIQTIVNGEIGEDDCIFLSKNIRPEVMYQIAMDELDDRVLNSLGMLEGYEPNYYHYFLAEALKRGNWVFTTNPDNLIETACEKRGIKVKRYYGRNEDFEEYLRYMECAPQSRQVVKVCLREGNHGKNNKKKLYT